MTTYRIEIELTTPEIDGLNEITVEDHIRKAIEQLVGFKVNDISAVESPRLVPDYFASQEEYENWIHSFKTRLT